MPRPPWGALRGQRHRLSLPASAPAGDPNFGPLIATGRKFPELLPGEKRRHLSGAHPFVGPFQVSVARSVSLATWQGPGRHHSQPGSLLMRETECVKLSSGPS